MAASTWRVLLRVRVFPSCCSRRVVGSMAPRTVSTGREYDYTAEEVPVDRIRNFSIVAHVDHGKSTLADRLLEITKTVSLSESVPQLLDQLPVERERGITVKAQSATMYHEYNGQTYMLNLIDTPGHVDFSYEVSRSLAACHGVVLLVDAQQGVQAQTVANFLLSSEAELTILPAINKIDLKLADVGAAIEQMNSAFGFTSEQIVKVSAKLGTGVPQLLNEIIDRIPCPPGSRTSPLKMLLFDNWYDKYRGVVCLVAVHDGLVQPGDLVSSAHTGSSYKVSEVGLLRPKQSPQHSLGAGQVGYVILGMKVMSEAHIGDTLHHTHTAVEPAAGFRPAQPMVFAGLFPADQSELPVLRSSLEKLCLNDRSVVVKIDSSVALGQGWRLGFLGLLHMEVFTQRLEEEFGTSVILTSPSVPCKAILKTDEEVTIYNPAQFPVSYQVKEYLEPMVTGSIVLPDQYLGKVLQLCEGRRGVQKEMLYLNSSRVLLKYEIPLSEVVVDFYHQLKTITSGYGSFDYEDSGYQPAKLVKLNILLNGVEVDALTSIVHADKAYAIGKKICAKLKDTIHRQLFEIAIQAASGSKVIARETVRALRKNVTAKCYGGDISRRNKLLQRQKEGKKKMRSIGNVELSKDAFLAVLER